MESHRKVHTGTNGHNQEVGYNSPPSIEDLLGFQGEDKKNEEK